MANLLDMANSVLTNTNRFLYGSTPVGKALSEVGQTANKAGRSIRSNPNPVNIAAQLANTGMGVLNTPSQTLFHALKATPANRLGVQTPFGRVDAPGVAGLAAGLLTPAPELKGVGLAADLFRVPHPGNKFLTWDRLVSHEGVNADRVAHYVKKFTSGMPIEPITVKAEKNGLYGVEDGKHRLAAYKHLGLRDVPVIVLKGNK